MRRCLPWRHRGRVQRPDAAIAAAGSRAQRPAGHARRLPRRSAAAVPAGAPPARSDHRRGDGVDRARRRRRERPQGAACSGQHRRVCRHLRAAAPAGDRRARSGTRARAAAADVRADCPLPWSADETDCTLGFERRPPGSHARGGRGRSQRSGEGVHRHGRTGRHHRG